MKLSAVLFLLVPLIAGCSGGSSSEGSSSSGADGANFGCSGGCAHQFISADEVRTVVAQGASEAARLGVAATISVVDRVGNVLIVYQMTGARATTTFNGGRGAVGGLEGVTVPSTLAAISKAGTGAFLSSQSNAFSSRTASQIIQENFDPGEHNAVGGPLFGVQFSQLICSDVTTLNPAFTGGARFGSKAMYGGGAGPRPMPLGLSGDSGGIPLYKQGDVVGGVGVELDGLYTIDINIADYDDDIEERIALAASRGFETPSERAADIIHVAGHSLRYTDLTYNDLGEPAPSVAFDPSLSISVPVFTDGTVRDGVTFGALGSGVADTVRAGIAASILVDASGAPRFPARNGTSLGGAELSAGEVDALLDSVLATAHRTRAAIGRDLDTEARVSIWIVDTAGIPLGFVRSQDAPFFGIDVALQKARSAAFFSSSDAGSKLTSAGFGGYVAAATGMFGQGILSGANAVSDRAIGNISRPFFPDGINGNPPGPLSLPFPGSAPGASWSPFNVGLQLDLSFAAIAAPLSGTVLDNCAGGAVFGRRLQNGLQIFPGSVPLYRDQTLIGAVGISGDGVDQDDLIAFYGASRQGLDFAGHQAIGDARLGFNAPPAIRSDQLEPRTLEEVRLRYVNCPEAPFIGDNDQNVCDGL